MLGSDNKTKIVGWARLVVVAVWMCQVLVFVSLADYKKVGGGLNFFSSKQEVEMGSQYSAELQKKLALLDDPFISEYINQMGQKLVENSLRTDIAYKFFVVNSKEVNAFALPGGFVYVERGLLEASDSESELAGVIGHEIGHVVGHHATKQMSKQLLLSGLVMGAGTAVGGKSERWGEIVQALGGVGTYLATLKYSRDDERQSDWLGLQEMVKAGYDPQGMVTFFQKLEKLSEGKGGQPPAILSTHPLTSERIQNVENEIQELGAISAKPVRTTYSYQKCKEHLAQLPAPPAGTENSLGNALASLDPAPARAEAPPAAVTGATGSKSLVIPGTATWVDTGVDLTAGQYLEIQARGHVYWKRNSQQNCPPEGAPGTAKGFWKPIPEANTGALIARIGADSQDSFAVGSRRAGRVHTTGRLFLGINDDNTLDNRGEFQVSIRVVN